MKIGQAHYDASAPKSLFDPRVPAEIAFRLEPEIIPENFVLTGGRAESSRDARMQMRVGFRDQITAGKPVGPDIAELIEVIVAPASHQIQSLERRDARFKERGRFHCVIAVEGGPKQDKRPPLSRVDIAVEQSTGQRQP
ncbi:MAG: hypothetical protein QOE34_1675 [Verrucomicrobiota bacterium]